MISISSSQEIPNRNGTLVTLDEMTFSIWWKDVPPEELQDTSPMMHNHSFLELQLIVGGEGVLRTETEELPLHPGDCLMIGPQIRHQLDSPSRMERFELQIAYIPGDILPERLLSRLSGLRVRVWPLGTEFALLGRFANQELRQKAYHYDYIICTYFIHILTGIARCAGLEAQVAPIPERQDKTLLAELSRIDDIFTLNPRIKGEELAKLLHTSKRQLYRMTKDRYGAETLMKRSIAFRLERAKKLLLESEAPIQQIAESVGYESAASFSLMFKKRLGISPREYRKRYR